MPLNYNLNYQNTVAITTASNQVLPLNNFRKYLFIQNQGTDTIFIQYGSPQLTKTGKKILAGSSYEPIMPPVGAVYVIANSGTQNIFICEGVE